MRCVVAAAFSPGVGSKLVVVCGDNNHACALARRPQPSCEAGSRPNRASCLGAVRMLLDVPAVPAYPSAAGLTAHRCVPHGASPFPSLPHCCGLQCARLRLGEGGRRLSGHVGPTPDLGRFWGQRVAIHGARTPGRRHACMPGGQECQRAGRLTGRGTMCAGGSHCASSPRFALRADVACPRVPRSCGAWCGTQTRRATSSSRTA